MFIHVCAFLFSGVSVIHNKDLLATLHLLVAMVRAFQPELDLPQNVTVEVVVMQVSFNLSLFLQFSFMLLSVGSFSRR